MPVDDGYKGGVGSDRVGINVPVPDPSLLTTQQLREGLEGLEKLIGVRLTAMDEATHLRMDMLLTVPNEIDKQIIHMREVTQQRFNLDEEKFRGVEKQFTERDVRTEQASTGADQALNAALQAAKELVGAQGEASAAAAVKSETSFTKQIDQIGTIIQTLEKALDARITELKERIDRGEGSQNGTQQTVNNRRADSTVLISIVVAVFSFVALASSIIIAIVNRR